MKYQNNCRDKTEIPNCRNWRENEIPKQLQRHNRNTKLQKLIPNYRNWREDEIPKQLQRQNRNTKLQKLKRRRNTKIIAETDKNTKLQKLKDSPNTRFCRSGRQNITPIFFLFFFCRNLTQIPNCRNWRENEIPKQLQRQNKNTKLQKLIPNCRNWREDKIPKQLQRQNINTKLQKLKNLK